MSTVSYWGVNHGEEISKGEKSPTKLRTGEALGAGALGSVYGAVKAKKGKKVNTAGRMFGRGLAENAAAASATNLVGTAVTRGKSPLGVSVASGLAGSTGLVHGNIAAYRNAKKRGAIK